MTLQEQVARAVRLNRQKINRTYENHNVRLESPTLTGISTRERRLFVEASERFRNSYANRFVKLNENVSISAPELARIRQAERQINTAQRRQQKYLQNQLYQVGIITTDMTVLERARLGDDRGAVFRKIGKDLSKVKTEQELKSYIDYLEDRRVDTNFLKGNTTSKYKQNYIEGVKNHLTAGGLLETDDEIEDIIEGIKRMSDRDFFRLYVTNELSELKYVYAESDLNELKMTLLEQFVWR